MSSKVRPPPSLFSNVDFPTFSLYDLFQEILNRSINTLVDFQEKLEDFSDNDKKKTLFSYFSTTRERLLRILVLIRFLRKTEQADYFQDVGSKIKDVLGSYSRAADRFHITMMGIGNLRERKFDIDTSVKLLTTGTYDLPKSLKLKEDLEVESSQKELINQRVNDFINLRLLKEHLPKSLVVDRNEKGRIKLLKPHEYKVTLTLDQEFRWKLLKIKLLVNELGVTTSPVSFGVLRNLKYLISCIFNSKRYKVGVLTRMDEILHDLCVKLAMDIITGQAKHLSKVVFKDIIRTETPYIESQDKFSVKLLYWKVNPVHLAENIKPHPLFTALEGHQAVLSVTVNKQKELQIEHFPVLHHSNENRIKPPKIFHLDEIDIGMLWQNYLFQFIVSRLKVVMGFIRNGKYYDGEKLFLHLGPGKPCLNVDIVENWKMRLGVDWTSGEWVFSFLNYGRNVPSKDVKGLNPATYVQRLHEDLSSISKSVFEIKMMVMMYGYEEASKFLGLRHYDEKRVLRFLKNMGHYVAKRFRERKCLYIPFPKIPVESWNYLVIYPSVLEVKNRFSLRIRASLLLYQGKKMTLIDLKDEIPPSSSLLREPPVTKPKPSRKRKFDDVKEYQDEKARTRPIELPDEDISSTSKAKRPKKAIPPPNYSIGELKTPLNHLRYLLAKHRHLVMRNILFQELTRIFPFFQVKGPDRVSFSYRLRVGGRLSLLLIVLPNGLWEVRCNFYGISFDTIDTSVVKNFRVLEDDEGVINNEGYVRAIFSYQEDELWMKFLGDLTSLNRMLHLHYQLMGKPIPEDDVSGTGWGGWRRLKDADEDEYPTKCYHSDSFVVESSLKAINITYDVEKNYKCEIRWSDTNRKYNVTLRPESGISRMLERLLDNEGGRVAHLVHCLTVSSKYILRYKATFAEKYCWTVIPRSLATFCVVYQSPHYFQCYIQFSQKNAVFLTRDGTDRIISPLEESERAFQRYCYFIQLRIILKRYSGSSDDKFFNMVNDTQYQLKSKRYFLHLDKHEGKMVLAKGGKKTGTSSKVLAKLSVLLEDLMEDRLCDSQKFLYDKIKSYLVFIRYPHRIVDEIVEGVENYEDESTSVQIQWIIPKDLNLPYQVFEKVDKQRFRVGKSCLSQFKNKKNGHHCGNFLLRFVKKERKRLFEQYYKRQQEQQQQQKKNLLYHIDIPFTYNFDTKELDISWKEFLVPGAVFGRSLGFRPKVGNQTRTHTLKNALRFLRNQTYDVLMRIK